MSNPNRSLKLVLICIEIIENSFFDISTTLVVAYDPRRHQDTISRRQRSPFARVDLSTYLFLYCEIFDRHVFKRVLAYFPLSFRLLGGFFPFWDPIHEAFLFCEPLFLCVCLGFGLWASSGPFPLSIHFGLYKRGRDPPPNKP